MREEIEVMARAIWVRMRRIDRQPEHWDALPKEEKGRPRRLARAVAEALAAYRAKDGDASRAECSVRSGTDLSPDGDSCANPVGDPGNPDVLTVLTQHLERLEGQLEEAQKRADAFILQRDAAITECNAARTERDVARVERDVATTQMLALRAAWRHCALRWWLPSRTGIAGQPRSSRRDGDGGSCPRPSYGFLHDRPRNCAAVG
jgi:hypothetical protein